jgi:hypothetical protein
MVIFCNYSIRKRVSRRRRISKKSLKLNLPLNRNINEATGIFLIDEKGILWHYKVLVYCYRRDGSIEKNRA